RDFHVTGVQTCALPISVRPAGTSPIEVEPMLTVTRDLLRYDGRFRVAFVFLVLIVILSGLSFVSPYSPARTFEVPADMPPSLSHPFGTSSRGQDLFWWMAYAVRNSLVLGLITALVSRVIAIFVGLAAGYQA